MYKTFNILLDTEKEIKNYPFTLNSNDLNTPKLIFTIAQKGQPVILNGATVRLAIQKPDGMKVFIDGVITNGAAGECEFVLTTQSYTARGSHNAELMIYYTADQVAVTGNFNYQVKLGIMNDEALESTNEFQLLYQSTIDAEAAAAEANTQADYAKAQGDATKKVAEDNKTRYLDAVSTVEQRETSYPDPLHGDTVRVTSEAKTYRYVNGTGWVVTDEYNPAAIDEVNEQLAQTALQIDENAKKVYGKTTKPVQNMVVPYSDDGAPEDYTVLKPIADAKGIPFTIAAIPGAIISNTASMTISQLLELQSNGWEINSHTYNHVDLTSKTEAEMDQQMKDSKEFFESRGLTCKSICYPYGYYNDTAMKVARKYYRAGLGSDQNVNSSPINTFNLYRLNFDAYDIATLKSKIDAMNNQLAILYTHPQNWVTNNTVDANTAKMNELIDYIQSKNITITTVDKALDIFENTMDIGDSTNKYFRVGADGKVEQKPSVASVFSGNNSGIKVDTPVTAFEKYKTTMTAFLAGENFGLSFAPGLATGGVLYTHRPQLDDSLSFQEFHLSDNTYILKRTWNNSTQSWNTFKVISGISVKREIYVDPIAANSFRMYEYTVTGLRLDGALSVTFETDLQDGVIPVFSVPVAGKIRIKLYNVTAAQITVGVKNIYITQH